MDSFLSICSSAIIATAFVAWYTKPTMTSFDNYIRDQKGIFNGIGYEKDAQYDYIIMRMGILKNRTSGKSRYFIGAFYIWFQLFAVV